MNNLEGSWRAKKLTWRVVRGLLEGTSRAGHFCCKSIIDKVLQGFSGQPGGDLEKSNIGKHI